MGAAYDHLLAACPTSAVLTRVGARWTPSIMTELDNGPKRFTELRRAIAGITAKALTESLRALETDNLITRSEWPEEMPPRVEYAITPLGQSLVVVLGPMRDWAHEHLADMRAEGPAGP